jgi:hypothetical protein
MTSRSITNQMSPKDRAKYGAALVKGAAFDAVQNLWRRRSAEGWTQARVASAVGVDEGWLSKQFVGPRNWTMETFGVLVEGLNGEVEIVVHAAEDRIVDRKNYDAYAEYVCGPVSSTVPMPTPSAGAIVPVTFGSTIPVSSNPVAPTPQIPAFVLARVIK